MDVKDCREYQTVNLVLSDGRVIQCMTPKFCNEEDIPYINVVKLQITEARPLPDDCNFEYLNTKEGD